MNDYQRRLDRLREALRARNARLAVFSYSDQMRYLTGSAEGGKKRLLALFVPAHGAPAFVVPSMNVEQVRANAAGIAEVIGWNDGAGYRAEVDRVFRAARLEAGDLVLVDDELHAGHLLALQAASPGVRWQAADETMAGLRGVKTPDELRAMEDAAALIDRIFEESLGALKEGMLERDLQAVLYDAFSRYETVPSFTPTVCFGPNGALPHHNTGNRPLERGDVVIVDIGCGVHGYASDITRTFAFGEPTDPDARAVYDIVSRAHHAARAAARPGVTCEDVDAAARAVIAGEGYGPYFVHRTGHGIGLSVHELPDIAAGSPLPLAPGMCFSVEPGIYLPGRFGVRIENIVTVTETGVRSLNAEPPAALRVV